jgi:hypothetical protein
MERKDNRIRVIIGHYGSGKTEFSVNYAIKLALQSSKVSLCDLDVVNPYFRSREKAEMLEEKGIHVISGAKGHHANLAIPMVASAILGPLQNKDIDVILDVGGDSVGARALARYKAYFVDGEYDMYCVINANREQTCDVEGIVHHIKEIEATAGIKVTGLINNTHMLRETTREDVLKGQRLAEEVSKTLDIPVKYTSVIASLADGIANEIENEVLPIHMIMREKWMS